MSAQAFFEAYGGSVPENYERYFVPAIGAPWAAGLVEVAALRPGERALDVVCRTGVVARLAAAQVGPDGSVAGLDISPAMLAVARASAPAGLSITWHAASAEAMPLPDAAFDVVLCQLGLQFIEDKPAALREMWRVLAPGGRLVVSVPGPTPPPLVVMEEGLARHVGPAAGAFVDKVFSLNDPDELRTLISDAGFDDVAVQSDIQTLRLPPPKDFLWQYVHSTPLADMVAQVDAESSAALERDVVAGWQEFVENGAMTLAVNALMATARK